MNQLPNFSNAVVEIRKLRDYCLNPNHPVGKHKAQVLKSVLGIQQSDAQLLKEEIIKALPNATAYKNFTDEFGTRYTVDIKIRIFE